MSLNIAELMEESKRLSGPDQGSPSQSSFLDNFVMMPEKDGVLVVRILPPAKDGLPMFDGGLCMRTRIHTINDRKIHCPREYVKNEKYPRGTCRICDHYNWLYRQRDELLRKGMKEEAEAKAREARAIKPVERFYFNVLVRGDDSPKILSVGKTLFTRIVRAICGDEELREPPLGDVTSLTNGRDLKIVKKMRHSGMESFPNYDNSKFEEQSPLGDPDQVKKWMSQLHDLASLRIVKTQQEIDAELAEYLGHKVKSRDSYNPSEFVQSLGIENEGVSVPEVSSKPQVRESIPDPDVSVPLDNDAFLETLRSLN